MYRVLCLTSAVLLFAIAPVEAQNLLVNPSFEDPLTSDGAPFVGFWEAFTSGAPLSQTSTIEPLSGSQHLELLIDNSANQFAGVFQDVDGLVAGQETTFSGWHKLNSGDSGGIEIRIEWRDSVGNTEISRTTNFAPTPGSAYEPFALTANVPAGADTARVVYAIQSFGGAVSQQMFVDDVSFTKVPEPASLVLLGLAGVGLLTYTRSRR